MKVQYKFYEGQMHGGRPYPLDRNHLFVIEDGKLYVDDWNGNYAGGQIKDKEGIARALENAKNWDSVKYEEMMKIIAEKK